MIISIIAIIVINILLASCSPSQSMLQTAIAQTIEAVPTNTPIPPTLTLTPTSTSTATITPSPTPDIRIYKVDPKDLLLSLSDLPTKGYYFLPNEYWTSPQRNSEILSGWGAEEGGKYINDIGRIDGWWVDYRRGSSKFVGPLEIYNSVVMCQTNSGAYISITKYADHGIPEFTEVIDPPLVGDISRAFYLKKGNSIEYTLDFAYRNYRISIDLYGLESQVTLKFATDLANIIIEKLETALLTLPD